MKGLPLLAEDSSEFRALCSSIDDLGVLEPLKLHKGRVVDGRDRLRAAIKAGRDEIPGVEICEGDLHSVILASLIARKHYTESAIAYLAFPHIEPVLKEAQARKMECLKRGAQAGDEARRLLSGLRGAQTAEEISDALGIGRNFLFSARDMTGQFEKNLELQAHFEPLIIAGEMGLGAVLQGIAAWEATKGQPKAARQLDLFWIEKTSGLIDKRKFSGWDKTPEAIRQAVALKVSRGVISAWPEEVVRQLAEMWLREKGATL